MRENSSEDKNDILDCFHIEDFKNLWEFRMACMRRDWYLSGKSWFPPLFKNLWEFDYRYNIVQLPPSSRGKGFFLQELEEAELAKDKETIILA